MGLFDPQYSTNTSSTQPDPGVRNSYLQLLDQAKGIANQPYQPYGGERLAGLSGYTQQAQGMAGGATDPAMNYANLGASQINGADALAKYGNPFQQSVINSANNDINRQYSISGQGVAANGVLNGAAFGDRSQILQAENERNRNDTLARTDAGLNTANYNQSMTAATNQADRYSRASSQVGALGQQQLSNLYNAGQVDQNQRQQQNNISYGNFLEQRGYPAQQASWLNSFYTGAPQLAGTTQTSQIAGPSVGQGLAGLGTAGLGALTALPGAIKGIGSLFGSGNGSSGDGMMDWSTAGASGGDYSYTSPQIADTTFDTSPQFTLNANGGRIFARGGIVGYADSGRVVDEYGNPYTRAATNPYTGPSYSAGTISSARNAISPTMAPAPGITSNRGAGAYPSDRSGNYPVMGPMPQSSPPSQAAVDLDRVIQGGVGYANSAGSAIGSGISNVAGAARSALGYFTDPANPTPAPAADASPQAGLVAPAATPPNTTPDPMADAAGVKDAQIASPPAGIVAPTQAPRQGPPSLGGAKVSAPAAAQQAGVGASSDKGTSAADEEGGSGGGPGSAGAPSAISESSVQATLKKLAPANQQDEEKPDAPSWALPLMTAGAAIMASKSPFALNAIGEGGLAGLAAYSQQREQKVKTALAERQVSTSERAQAESERHNVSTEDISRTTATKQLKIAERQATTAEATFENAKLRGAREDELLPARKKVLEATAALYSARGGNLGKAGGVDKIMQRAQYLMDRDDTLEPAEAFRQALGKADSTGADGKLDRSLQKDRADAYDKAATRWHKANEGRKPTAGDEASWNTEVDRLYPITAAGGPPLAASVAPTMTPPPDFVKQLKPRETTVARNGTKWTLGPDGKPLEVK